MSTKRRRSRSKAHPPSTEIYAKRPGGKSSRRERKGSDGVPRPQLLGGREEVMKCRAPCRGSWFRTTSHYFLLNQPSWRPLFFFSFWNEPLVLGAESILPNRKIHHVTYHIIQSRQRTRTRHMMKKIVFYFLFYIFFLLCHSPPEGVGNKYLCMYRLGIYPNDRPQVENRRLRYGSTCSDSYALLVTGFWQVFLPRSKRLNLKNDFRGGGRIVVVCVLVL